MNEKYQSELLMVCHQNAKALHRYGIIDDAKMREFDEGCLVPETTVRPSASRAVQSSNPHPAAALDLKLFQQ
jgi:DNA-binding transcriptional regulator YiaG